MPAREAISARRLHQTLRDGALMLRGLSQLRRGMEVVIFSLEQGAAGWAKGRAEKGADLE